MKVLHLIKTADGANWALEQIRELIALGVTVEVAMPPGKRTRDYAALGVPVYDIRFSLRKWRASVKRLRQIVETSKPDIIHSHFVLTTLIARTALRQSGIPRIFQVPGPLHLEHAVFRRVEMGTAQKCDYWVGSCQWTVDRYRQSGIDNDRLFLSYYGNNMARNPQSSGKLRKELGLPDDAILIGMVAYIYAPKRFLGQKQGLKGHEDFIDAIALLARRYPNLYGICIGGAWGSAEKYAELIQRYAKARTDRVLFLGTRQDVAELYGDLTLVVHPSHSENLGGAAESLMLGVPTITTDVGGFPDIVRNGETGLTIPPHSPRKIAEAIDRMIRDSDFRRRSAQNGQRLVHEMLDIRNTAASVYDIYQDVMRHEAQKSQKQTEKELEM